MLSQERRLRTKDITRLFTRTNTQKIVAYPFVYFVGPQSKKRKNMLMNNENQEGGTSLSKTYIQRGIQLPNKLIKTSVQRHLIKRLFYDCIEQVGMVEGNVCILAVPQKQWGEELIQLLATADKTRIVEEQRKVFIKSLSLLAKKYDFI